MYVCIYIYIYIYMYMEALALISRAPPTDCGCSCSGPEVSDAVVTMSISICINICIISISIIIIIIISSSSSRSRSSNRSSSRSSSNRRRRSSRSKVEAWVQWTSQGARENRKGDDAVELFEPFEFSHWTKSSLSSNSRQQYLCQQYPPPLSSREVTVCSEPHFDEETAEKFTGWLARSPTFSLQLLPSRAVRLTTACFLCSLLCISVKAAKRRRYVQRCWCFRSVAWQPLPRWVR